MNKDISTRKFQLSPNLGHVWWKGNSIKSPTTVHLLSFLIIVHDMLYLYCFLKDDSEINDVNMKLLLFFRSKMKLLLQQKKYMKPLLRAFLYCVLWAICPNILFLYLILSYFELWAKNYAAEISRSPTSSSLDHPIIPK